jgi:hypothetical protein
MFYHPTTNMPSFSTMPVKPNILPPFYDHGGHLRSLAEYLRRKGEGDDKVLAHIHPEEAEELERKYGSSGINPHTGLPQYGRWLSRGTSKFLKKAIPIATSLLGGAFLGPAGAVAGGGLGGAVSGRRDAEGHRKVFKNALRGLGTGALVAGGQYLASGLPGINGPVDGSNPLASIGSSLGKITDKLGGLGGIFGGGSQQSDKESDKENDKEKKPKGIFSDPLGLALLGTAVAGHLGRRHKKQPAEPQHPAVQRMLDNSNFDYPIPKMKPIRQKYIPLPEGYRSDVDPEHSFFEEVNPPVEYYADGGFVHGETGGQDDLIEDRLEPKSYIIDASSTSDLGDGNSLAGAKKLDTFFNQRGSKKTTNGSNYISSTKGMIPAKISDGEYYINAEKVTALGNGDNNKGAKILKKGIQKLRQEKRTGGQNLPKKAKPMQHYFGPDLKSPKNKFAAMHDNVMRY